MINTEFYCLLQVVVHIAELVKNIYKVLNRPPTLDSRKKYMHKQKDEQHIKQN